MTLPKMSNGFHSMGEGEEFKEMISDMIAGTNLFASLAADDIQVLANYVQGYRVTADTVIFQEGDAGSFLCLLIQGEVEIYKADAGGWYRELVNATRGTTIGEMSLIDHEPRSATCIAKEDSLVLILNRQNFDTILQQHHGLAVELLLRIAKLLSQRLRTQNGQMVDFISGYSHSMDKPS